MAVTIHSLQRQVGDLGIRYIHHLQRVVIALHWAWPKKRSITTWSLALGYWCHARWHVTHWWASLRCYASDNSLKIDIVWVRYIISRVDAAVINLMLGIWWDNSGIMLTLSVLQRVSQKDSIGFAWWRPAEGNLWLWRTCHLHGHRRARN